MEFKIRFLLMPAVASFLFIFTVALLMQNADASLSESWENVKNSDAVQQVQKEWARSKVKTQSFVDKATSGKLSDDITTYIDNTLVKTFNIRVSELQKTLKKAQQTWLSPVLLALWIILGFLTLQLTSVTSCMVIMSMTVILHAIFGPVVVFTQVVIFIGLCMYFTSQITNNLILTSITVVTCYVFYSIFGFCRRGNTQSMLYDLEDKVSDLHEKTLSMERNLDKIDEKLDEILERNQ
ncbi:uncharacterized protein LOC117290796 [Asterias rubens]|uniref:uncharacterized protein LOC117290796 n=1 Tax=Asterias rubens TaxID=7604 RepID=UPI0014553D66|nr:uncharacterized protein LOC117290796 [Asterias rubens]